MSSNIDPTLNGDLTTAAKNVSKTELKSALQNAKDEIEALQSGSSIASGAITTVKLASNSVTNAKLSDMSASRIKGRASGSGSGDPQDLTASQVRTILNVEDGATADQTDAEIETAYNNRVGVATQGQAEDDTDTNVYRFTPERVHQAAKKATTGKQSIWVPATAMQPTKSFGAAPLATTEITPNGNLDIPTIDFDQSSFERAGFWIRMPKGWNEGQISFQVYWTTTATGSGGVRWILRTLSFSNGDTFDGTNINAQGVTDNALSGADKLCVSDESASFSVQGSPAEGDLVYMQLVRNGSDGDDTMAADAKAIGVMIFFTTDAPTDD